MTSPALHAPETCNAVRAVAARLFVVVGERVAVPCVDAFGVTPHLGIVGMPRIGGVE